MKLFGKAIILIIKLEKPIIATMFCPFTRVILPGEKALMIKGFSTKHIHTDVHEKMVKP